MKAKKLIITSLLTGISALGASAQEYYDITQYYLQNADFSKNVAYDATATGDVKNTMKTPDGWTPFDKSKANMAGVATFSYGTAATFGGISIPATGPDGTADGACLTLCGAFGTYATFYQEASLPAGNYQLQVTYYNCNPDAEGGTSTSGWYVSASDNVLSQTTSFGIKEWRTDVIAFTLDKEASGQLRVGFKAGSGLPQANAMIAVDNVKLLRDVPYGDADVTGDVPTVVGDMRFARGATMAFGRIKSATIGDGKITEKGFCWSENPEPTVKDKTTTETVSNGAYWLKDLKPATKYYMRAYAKTAGKQVGYGEVIKFYTLPKGQVTFTMRTSGDEASNRIKAAAQTAVNWWNALTEMKGFNTSIGYNSGTPTAECSYGGWMSVGSNTSYQRPGTIMHEMLHGVGVIPWAGTEWAGSNLRSGNGTGQWLGDRVTEVLRFWKNNTTEVLNGDTQHLWPYGINGASEDNGSNELYIGNGLVCQALGEDGLQHTSSLFAEPYYALDQEDDVKYYLKNESEDRGLFTSYLIPTSTGTLKWRTMTAAEAQQNDSTAWNITFTPTNQYYQFRNVATGQYLTYASGVKTMTRTTLTANDNWHLMKGRIDVGTGSNAKRGYWIIHPTGNWTPAAMQANTNGAVATANFNIANAAKTQRWLILTAEEMGQQEEAAKETLRKDISSLLTNIRALADVPHFETEAGTDDAFAQAIADIEQRAGSDIFADLLTLSDETLAAVTAFLSNVIAKEAPFDLSFRLTNPGFDDAEGWSEAPSVSNSCAEFYERSFDINQTVSNLPAGTYEVKMQGFQRPGTSADSYNDYVAGTNNVNTNLYAGSKSTRINHIAVDAQDTNLGGTKVGGKYIPNTMQSASKYFAKGLYENTLETTVTKNGGSLKIGLRCSSMPGSYWVIFDNFRLYFAGGGDPGSIVGIQTVNTQQQTADKWYDLQGRIVEGTPKAGVYVVGGRKVVVKP
jgi:hypothetical protein